MACPNLFRSVFAAACLLGAAYAGNYANSAETTSVATTVTTTTSTVPLEDCVCENTWQHDEFKCKTSGSPAIIRGCPSLDDLAVCEVEPQMSWCMTTAATCKQQQGGAVGESWTFCDAATQKPTLPHCTCASRWLNEEGYCGRSGKRNQGCPTIEEIRECDPDYNGTNWCLTNEAECLEQEDWAEETQVGAGWAFCDVQTQSAELPVCECEDQWSPSQDDCDDDVDASSLTFDTCPTHAQLQKCKKNHKSTDQSFCSTKQDRCRQQSPSSSDEVDNMVGEGWSFCTPPTEDKPAEPVWPTCTCSKNWDHREEACYDDPFRYTGCPTVGNLLHCEKTPLQSWCETTYSACEEQSYQSDGGGWVYCDAETQKAELPFCECMNEWTNDEDECEATPVDFRGCPTVAEIATCDPEKPEPWCYTTETYCKEQNDKDDNKNEGWVFCDPVTQRAEDNSDAGTVSAAISITFILTVMLCAAAFVGVLYAYRSWTQQEQAEYTKALLGDTKGDDDINENY